MIEVPWIIAAEEAENTNTLSHWIQRHWDMPWLQYLLENNNGIETEKFYNAPSHMYEVKFKFKIDPKKETFYRIKYGT